MDDAGDRSLRARRRRDRRRQGDRPRDLAAMINGEIVAIDGGYTAQ
ncbi:MAG TPA: hypothetical protein VFH48_15940 [Chloroflexota bacterium]|nr:hypothetical protein [Chloroflexota bacterium]